MSWHVKLPLSLAQRLILGIVPLALLGITVTGLFLYRVTREPILKNVQREIDAVAETALASAEGFAESRLSDLDAVAESPLIRDYYKNREYGLAEEAETYREELAAYLRAVSARTRAYESILYLDWKGRLQARTPASAVLSPDMGRFIRAWAASPRGAPVLSQIRPAAERAAPAWLLGKPIYDGEGRYRGAIVMTADLSGLARILGGMKAGENGATALVQAAGGCFLGVCAPAGQEIVVSERGLRRQPWKIRTTARIDDFLGPLDRVRNYALLLSAVCGLIVGLLIWAQVAQVTAPLKDLVEAARRLGEGELGHRVAVRGSPEIAGLSGHFNAMASSLQARDAELKARLREIESLKSLSDAVIGELDYDQISRLSVRAAVDGLGFERGGLYRVEEGTGEIRGFCTYNTSQAGFADEDIARRRIPADSGDILAWVVRERRPANIPNPSADPRCNPEFVRESGTRGFCLAPVMTSDRVYAVIAVDNRESGRPISDDQVRTLTLFCSAAGLAFQNLVLLRDVYRSEARYRAVVDGSLDAIIALDASERVTLWNEGARRIFGYSAGEMEGCDLRRLFSEGEWERLKSAASGREPLINFEARGKSRDGKVLVLSLTWTRSGPRTAEAPEWSLVMRDVTAEKAILCQLIQSEKLALTGQLLSGVAHELNNPLTNVLGYAGIISESLGGLKLPEEFREDLDQIALNAKRCASIVTNLLLFVRKERAEKQSVCLTRVVRESLHLLDYSFKKKDNIEVRVDLEKDLPPVWGSFPQIQQVLVNVLQNAAGAMSRPETPKQVALRARRAGEWVILDVEDNGPGIPAALREKIFEPFFTTKADGTGLGLAICRQILSDHGGSIRCGESPLGGASFQFRLPWSRNPSSPDEGYRAWPACPGKSVLIVDDEPGVLDLMRKVLLEDGQKVETARSGREALAKLKKRRYDLVIADQHMEGVTGRSIRDVLLKDSSPARFLLVTGDVLGLGSGAEAEDDGGEVLVKPFSTSALRQSVRKLLRLASPPPA